MGSLWTEGGYLLVLVNGVVEVVAQDGCLQKPRHLGEGEG